MEGHRIARVIRDGRDVAAAALEGEVLTGGGDRPGEDHRPLGLAETPRTLINAVLAAEDRRFFEHGPVDPLSLLRAAWTNLRAGRVAQGGSTITQQLVKIRLLTPRRTALRKLQEAWLAFLIECRYSKNQILEAYLNEVYLGQRGPQGIRGVGAAARAYFGKEAHQLTAGEAAIIAGMVRAPNTYSPALDPARARERRDVVLARMRELDMLDAREYDRARREPVRAQVSPGSGQDAPYFADAVRQELEQRFDESALQSPEGVRIVTTLDRSLQRFAEHAVARGLDRLESSVPRLRRASASARLQAALVALDPATGEIRALVGGRDYRTSQFNRALMARRQPGSAFKPFVYAAALSPRDGHPRFTAASIVDDSPMTIQVSGRPWTPRNYEDRYAGRVTLRQALEQSLNSATVRLAQAVSLADVVATAHAFGLGDNLARVPAVALGAFEVTPLELARAYVPFANAGVRPGAITAVRGVYRGDGRRMPPMESALPVRVVSPAEAYVMTTLLQGVIRAGTGAAAQALGVSGDDRGEDRDHQRGARRMVRRLLVDAARGRLGRLRRRPASCAERGPGGAAHLGRFHAAGARGLSGALIHRARGRELCRDRHHQRETGQRLLPARRARSVPRRHRTGSLRRAWRRPETDGRVVGTSLRLAAALILTGVLAGCGAVPDVVRPPPMSDDLLRPLQTGYASWYGKAHQGRRTTSGETYDMNKFTAAHPALPMGTQLLVTNLKNGRSVTVRVNDRGPFVDGRIVDLSYAAAREVGAIGDGVVPVRIRVVSGSLPLSGGLTSMPRNRSAG